jgi:hypothetical protein
MRRLCALIVIIFLGMTAVAAPSPNAFRLDVSATAFLPLTWSLEGPALPHAGLGGAAALEFDSRSWIPARLELGGFAIWPSAISSGGELYRGWNGFRSALYAGYRFPPVDGLSGGRFSILLGGALTAAGYRDTNLAFAYPSLAAGLRFDPKTDADSAFFASLPLELMFRGTDLSFAAGISIGWRMDPKTRKLEVEGEE